MAGVLSNTGDGIGRDETWLALACISYHKLAYSSNQQTCGQIWPLLCVVKEKGKRAWVRISACAPPPGVRKFHCLARKMERK